MTYLWPIHELQVLSTSSSQNSLIPVVNLLQNMERSLLRQFHLDFPHKNRGQDIRSAGCSVLRSPQPTPPSRGAAEQTCSKASTAAVSDLDRQMPQISNVLRIQISPGVIGGDRIVADYSQDRSQDGSQNGSEFLSTAGDCWFGVTKNPCFNVAPNFWTFTDLLEVIPPSPAISRTLKKKNGYNVVK